MSIREKVIDFWKKYESKIIGIIGFVLVAIISFEFGVYKGAQWQPKPIIVEKVVETQIINKEPGKTIPEAQNLPQNTTLSQNGTNIAKEACAFVGSKNSNKYHIPTCQWAKRIKPENVVCFKSVEEATNKGYQPDNNCIK